MIDNSNRPAAVPSDAELIKRAGAGDADAFAVLFNAHKSRIHYLCLRMTGNVELAEDLTQEVFIQVFRKLHKFRGDAALSTWLHRVAVNAVLMHLRRKSPHHVSLDQTHTAADGSKLRREVGTRDRRLAGCIDRISLNRAIKELPPGYRAIFVLHEIQGYEHQEIAKMLGSSIGNSKSQLHKAKLRIRQLLLRSPQPASGAASPNEAGRRKRICVTQLSPIMSLS